MEGITMTYTNRRDFLKTVTATAVLTAIPPVQAKETPTMSKENFADVNGQHIFYSVHGAGKPLILLHGGINPDSFGSNLAELAKGRQVIAVHLQAHGRTPDTDRPLRCETMGDDVAALIGHLKLGKADVMGYSLGSFVALQTAIRHPDAVDRLVLMAARMRQDDAYPEVVAAFNQLEANAAMLGGSVKASPLERTLVLLAVTTGLRRSELFALKWKDVDFHAKQIHVTRSIVQNVVGLCKTESSQKPVPAHDDLMEALREWQCQTPYQSSESWVFASPVNQG